MSMWDGNELERRTLARVAATGFVPAINVKHRPSQSEFDVYAFLPQQGGFRRLMVQCTTAAADATKVAALKTYANTFNAHDAVFVTTRKPHKTVAQGAALHPVDLLSEDPNAPTHSCTIGGVQLDVRAQLTDREKAIRAFLRGIAWLRRVALAHRKASPEAQQVVDTWGELDQVFLTADPFSRLQKLYDIHNSEPELAQKCAGAEGLAATAYDALWEAMVKGDGTYTQSALAAQTINRTYTLITFAECACAVADGATIPASLADPRGRRGALIQALSCRNSRMACATVAFEFIHGFGGLWSGNGHSIAPHLAALAGVSVAEIDDARSRIDTLLRDAGMQQFIKSFDKDYGSWECFALLPHFSKGIGVRRLITLGTKLDTWPFTEWNKASCDHEAECRKYEQSH